MDIEFLIGDLVNKVLSTSDKNQIEQIIRENVAHIIKISHKIGFLDGKDEVLDDMIESLGKHGL